MEAGYLAREQYAEIPPRVEHDLTDSGTDLCQRLEPLLEWAEGGYLSGEIRPLRPHHLVERPSAKWHRLHERLIVGIDLPESCQ